MTATCPTCSGEQMPNHPAGWLAWQHENGCLTRMLEDATAAADFERVRRRGPFKRTATPAELTLLAALGYPIPTGLLTAVAPMTTSVVYRGWPTLAGITPAPLPAPAPTAADPWAAMRPHEGQLVYVQVREVVTDPDDEFSPVEIITREPGIFSLPAPPETDEDR